jgi:glutamate carboxypeptidase
MTGQAYTVVGGGAIGGTLAHSLARAGHPVTLIDTDAEHIEAIASHGLTVVYGDDKYATVRVRALTPDAFEGRLERVLLAVKAQATETAMSWIAPRLAEDGFVVSVQNGFNEAVIARHIGAERTVGAFVDLFADVIEPGVIKDGGLGAFVIGEMGGAPVSDRVRSLVDDLQAWGPVRGTDNVEGFLWAKAGFGAMLAATALADDTMADLIDRHRHVAHAVAREVFDVADSLGVRLESFDSFEARAFRGGAEREVREAATDHLTAWLRTQSKDRSGIWRDLAVRHRPVEVTTHYATVFEAAGKAGVETPVLRAVVAGLRELEEDASAMAESRLDALDRLAGALGPSGVPERPALSSEQARSVAEWLEEHREDMVADLAAYTERGSSSDDLGALDDCLNWLRNWLDGRLGPPDEEELMPREGAGDILLRRYASHAAGEQGPPVLLLCHYDTVWPTGTLEQWPFRRKGDTVSGPGVFDMKAGLVQAVWALRALAELGLPRPACTLLLNGDEETGSLVSSDTIVAEARASRAALVFEASVDGAVKTGRKGVGLFTLEVTGEEAHAGLDPDAGASAIDEAAQQILKLGALRDRAAGTTLNVGVLHGGTRSNVTAGHVRADFDVRVSSAAEHDRVSAALASPQPVDSAVDVRISGAWNRPVFARTPAVAQLFALAGECARPLGLELREKTVGGASDGNFAQTAGIPVLDGLGAVGDGAHARSEHASVSGMVERAALAAGVLAAFGE